MFKRQVGDKNLLCGMRCTIISEEVNIESVYIKSSIDLIFFQFPP